MSNNHSHPHAHDHDDHGGHSHGGHDHGHDHSHDDPTVPAEHSNLYTQIDFDKIITLNEREPGSGKAVVKKSWNERLDLTPELVSDTDEQLLMTIPFISQVTIHTLLLNFPPTMLSPSKIQLFRNRPTLDFSTAESLPATQSFQLPSPSTGSTAERASGVTELALSRAKWNGTTSVTMFVEANHSTEMNGGEGDEETTVSYIGFRGTWVKLNREPVSVLYEAAPNPTDHKVIQGLGMGVQGGLSRGT